MKRPNRSLFILAVLGILATGVASGKDVGPLAGGDEMGDESGWFCPPCGDDHDNHAYEEAGACPVCGMELVTREEWEEMTARRKKEGIQAAILLFDGVQIIDFTGPYEVFGQARFDVFTVSETGETVTTAMGMSVNPTYSFADSPAPDVVLVPGGDVHGPLGSDKVLSWVRQRAESADYVLSVCNGAFILAEAGLLDGKTATTFYGMLDELESSYPQIEVVRDQRYTDNGNILSSAGLSSGIDASLHLVSKIRGEKEAERLALHLEYDWDPESDFARGALADLRIPDLDLPDGVSVKVLDTEGDRERWEISYAIETDLSAGELMGIVEEQLAANRWTRTGSDRGDEQSLTEWTFDSRGEPWVATCTVEPAGQRSLVGTIAIWRAPTLAAVSGDPATR